MEPNGSLPGATQPPLRIVGPPKGKNLALVVAGSPVHTAAERDAEMVKSKINDTAIWASVCERSAVSAKQQIALEKLQHQVAQLELEGMVETHKGNEMLPEMENSISKVVTALSSTQLDLGNRIQVVYEPVTYTHMEARVVNRPRLQPAAPNGPGASTSQPVRLTQAPYHRGGRAGQSHDYCQQNSRGSHYSRGRGVHRHHKGSQVDHSTQAHSLRMYHHTDHGYRCQML